MGKIIVEGTDEELKRVTGPSGVKVSAFVEPDTSELEAKAKLAEEVEGQLAESVAEIARLKEELAEATAEVSDDDRFSELVSDIDSLTKEGKARLAEATGWAYQEPEPKQVAPVAEAIDANSLPFNPTQSDGADGATPPARHIRFVVRTK